eukprot:12597675-Alexandrium_andersonii.AAC.1
MAAVANPADCLRGPGRICRIKSNAGTPSGGTWVSTGPAPGEGFGRLNTRCLQVALACVKLVLKCVVLIGGG